MKSRGLANSKISELLVNRFHNQQKIFEWLGLNLITINTVPNPGQNKWNSGRD
jgi:hypothetical protein